MFNSRFLFVRFLILLFSLPELLSAQNSGSGNSPSSTSFSFTLKINATTSAGVYGEDGSLIRTLWSGVKYSTGTYKETWDGKDDMGKTVVEKKFEIKVLSNNVQYEWEGASIGNTSTALTGNTKHRLYEPIRGLAIVGNTAYVAGGYNEAWPAQYKFDLSTPQQKKWIGQLKGTDQATDYVATDGIYVYWGGYDALEEKEKNKYETFVYATRCSDDQQVNFGANGTPAPMEWGHTYPSTISYMQTNKNDNPFIRGLAVMKMGLYLFVSRGSLNQIQVLNKTTGALIRTITISAPGRLTVDANDNLWVVRGSTIEKFKVNTDGTLAGTGVTVTSISSVGAITVSPDNSTLLVADINTQQIKAFNNSNATPLWTFGKSDGYFTDATVTDDKFYFRDINGEQHTYLSYSPDGSFWVGDIGNFRTQHYSKDRIFIDRIMSLPNTYTTIADPNNPSRLFGNYLEFAIDYTKPLAANNGSWALVKNWGANISHKDYDKEEKIRFIATLNNGRTYGTIRANTGGLYPVIELVEGGTIRFTGAKFPARTFISKDGSKLWNPGARVGLACSVVKFPLTGFDAQNNPIWSATPQTLTNTPPITAIDPAPWEGFRSEMVTPAGRVVYFDYTKAENGHGEGYHLGAMNKGDNKWLWRTAQATPVGYEGPFPHDGWFDVSNGATYPGGSALIYGENVFWGYHGEFWKQSQTNIWNHIDANTGLFVNQFGPLTTDFPDQEAFEGGAGNVFTGSVVEVNGNVYLYHNDEGVNNGLHRWKIKGLNTIQVQIATILPVVELGVPGTDLMAGLPLKKGISLENNTAGWTRFPLQDNLTNLENNYFTVRTGLKTYNRYKPIDVQVVYRQNSGIYTINRELGSNINLASWKLNGKINFEGSVPNTNNGGCYLEVLDNNDKVITRFYFKQGYPLGVDIMGNDKVIGHGEDDAMKVVFNKNRAIEISSDGGTYTFNYAGFDPVTTKVKVDATANGRNPSKLRMYFYTNAVTDNYYRMMNISEMRFSSNNSTVIVSQQGCSGTGSLSWQYWNNVPFTNVSSIPVNTNADGEKTLTSFSTPLNFSENYGARARGYICPPQTGQYVFLVCGDDKGELWLSTDGDPAGRQRIAYFDEWTNPGEYTKNSSQRSKGITLKAGQRYYIETLQLEGGGGDHLSVAWILPDGTTQAPIPGSSLLPFGQLQGQGQVQVSGIAPEIAITSPAINSKFTISNPVEIQASAVDSDGSISKVEFFAGDEKIGEDLTSPYTITWNPETIGHYNLTARATDNTGITAVSNKVEISINKIEQQTCSGTGSLSWQYWTNVPYGEISSIPVNKSADGERLLTSFSTPINLANSYGARARGYVCPPQTGQYVFYICGDDKGELWLSTNADLANRQRIAYFDEWTNQGEYTKNASQRSKAIFLQAGQLYYIESLHMEGGGADHLSVAWSLPDQTMEAPIPGSRLIPFQQLTVNALPSVAITSPANNSSFVLLNPVTITANATDTDGTISKVEFYAGNLKIGEALSSPYSINWNPGSVNSYDLTVKATDNKGAVSTSDKITIVVNQAQQISCSGTGSLIWQYWSNVPFGNISSIPVNNKPDLEKIITSFATPVNFSEHYGARARGYICAPQTGQYVFFVGGDDKGELWLSTDASPENKQRIAYFDEWANPGDYSKNASQRSKGIFLQAGQKYYIESLHLEGTGGDQLSVAWIMPDGTYEDPIPGARLIPFGQVFVNALPSISITSPVDNSNFILLNSINISANAIDTHGSISKVEFFAGTDKIGEDFTSPYSITWNPAGTGAYSLTARAIDNLGAAIISSKINVTVNKPVNQNCSGTGSLIWQYWTNVPFGNISSIPLSKTPDGERVLNSFSTPVNFSNYYGARTRGYICPPQTGQHTFYVAGDDKGELWLSTDANPDNKQRIAYFDEWTSLGDYTKNASQRSKSIFLEAGQKYYIESLLLQGGGGDHLSVAWQYGNEAIEAPIPGSRLLAYVETRSFARAAAPPTEKARTKTVRDNKSLYTITNLDLKTYPNPFVNTLNIECYIPEESNYSLQLYTIQGVLLKTIFTGNLKAGVSKFNLIESNLPSGVYICKLASGKKIINKQITLIK